METFAEDLGRSHRGQTQDTSDTVGVPFVVLQGVRIHTLSVEAMLDFALTTMSAGRRALITNVNVNALNLAQEQPWLKTFFNQSSITYCDGFGVKWGARILGLRIPYRYTPPDFIEELCARCAKHGLSVYLLGAKPRVADRAAANLKRQFPTLHVVGVQHGYFDQTPGSAATASVVAHINVCRPDLLIVCMGMPRQEHWLADHFPQLQVGVALTAGALCDYIAGTTRRAPRWMTDHGLEWLGRLLIEPHRLWRRYLIGNPVFLSRILRERVTGHDTRRMRG